MRRAHGEDRPWPPRNDAAGHAHPGRRPAGGVAIFAGGDTLDATTLQINPAPYRCSALAGSATSLPSSLTFSSFTATYQLMWFALDQRPPAVHAPAPAVIPDASAPAPPST